MMLKAPSYLLALSLVIFGGTQIAEAGKFSKCTAKLGKKGGKDAYKCVMSADPSSDPHFFDSFIEAHCEGKIKPTDQHSCSLAKQKVGDDDEQENDDDDDDEE